MTPIDSKNNFDLLRLFAAIQVAIAHMSSHLDHTVPFLSWMSALPGVPIFFFLSGLLIYGSYVTSLSADTPLRNFFIKRALRLYPGLWMCLLISAMFLLGSGYLLRNFPSTLELIAWISAQTTFFQFYNPDFLRAFGAGTLNGALWTIAVELQFYLLFPLVHHLLQKGHIPIIATVSVFVILNQVNIYLNPKETALEKILNVSFIPWFYMFLIGAITAHYSVLRAWLLKSSLIASIILLWFTYIFSEAYGLQWGNGINPIGFALIATICLHLAFRKPDLSNTYIKKNDISYGVYIYHMPVVNLILYLLGPGSWQFYLALLLTFIFASISWFLVEKPFLRRKYFAARYL